MKNGLTFTKKDSGGDLCDGQDPAIRGVDQPQTAPGKDIAHADAAQTVGEPIGVAPSDRFLIDSLSHAASA